jgi:hypothetical protein
LRVVLNGRARFSVLRRGLRLLARYFNAGRSADTDQFSDTRKYPPIERLPTPG